MKYKIEILNSSLEKEYTKFLLKDDTNLLYYSFQYKTLLENIVKGKSMYLLLFDNSKIIGIFPIMIYYNNKFGNIANSLPYYGSNGGISVSPKLSKDEKHNVRKILLQNAEDLFKNENCVASTIITNPLNREQNEWFWKYLKYNYTDERIGQITHLPELTDNLDDLIMKKLSDPRPRNIRKAKKSGVKFYTSVKPEDFEFIFRTHKENIESIGGISKTKEFFHSINKSIRNEHFYLYIASKECKKIAALLLFFFNKTVEYFTPATVIDFKNLQPSSLLIFEAMKDAVKRGFKYWNWGGTWLTQNGVYNFKKKWGANDYKYYYFTKVYDNNILNIPGSGIFYRFPNGRLYFSDPPRILKAVSFLHISSKS